MTETYTTNEGTSEDSKRGESDRQEMFQGDMVHVVDPSVQEIAEKKDAYLARGLAQISEYRVEYPALSRTLEQIDFGGLKELFHERLERVDPAYREGLRQHMPFAEKDRIVTIATNAPIPKSAANAHVDKMLITITEPATPPPLPPNLAMPEVPIPPFHEELKRVGEVTEALRLFHAVVHEETHLVSSEIPDEVYETGVPTAHRTGFEYAIGGGVSDIGEGIPSKDVLFRSLNEGMTERIAMEISAEYIRRNGLGNATSSDWEKRGAGAYQCEQLFVEALTELIALDAGVPRDVVWDAMNEAYFTGRRTRGAVSSALDAIGESSLTDTIARLSGEGYPANTPTVYGALRQLVASGKLSATLCAQIEATAQSTIVPPDPLPPSERE